MYVGEGEMARAPKKQKIKESDELMQGAKAKERNKIVKFKGPSFLIQEYGFSSVPKEEVSKYKSKAKLLGKYREVGKRAFEERSKLCEEVDKLPGQSTSLENFRDPTKGTLNLAMIIGDKVAELKVYPKRVSKTDIINLHQGISDVLYTDVLQDTLQISKLIAGKKRVEEML